MSLARKIQTQIDKALLKLLREGLGVSIDYVSVTPGTYDPASDDLHPTLVTVRGVPAATARLTEAESAVLTINAVSQAGPVKMSQKLFITALRLPGITVKEADYVLINGARWEIKKIASPPGNAVHIFYIQEP